MRANTLSNKRKEMLKFLYINININEIDRQLGHIKSNRIESNRVEIEIKLNDGLTGVVLGFRRVRDRVDKLPDPWTKSNLKLN